MPGQLKSEGREIPYVITSDDVTNNRNFAGMMVTDDSICGIIKSVAIPEESAGGGATEGTTVTILVDHRVSYSQSSDLTASRGDVAYFNEQNDEITKTDTDTYAGVFQERLFSADSSCIIKLTGLGLSGKQ